MGITKKDCEILFYSKTKLGVSFAKTLTLGRLNLYITKEEIETLINAYESSDSTQLPHVSFATKYSEPLFKILGANQIDSLDFSNYEEASIIHDLNNPIPNKYHNTYSAIVDGGTIEHVFNFPVAIKNCMDCLVVGGTYIGITPANNQMGHGFYQFSPELYFRVFSPENGFIIKGMFLKTNDSIYQVMDPLEVKSRVELVNSTPTTLIVIAEKTENISRFLIPQQSDYVTAWETVSAIKTGNTKEGSSKIFNFYRRLMPKKLKTIFRNLYDIATKEKLDDEILEQ